MYYKENISDEEINGFKDFDSLIKAKDKVEHQHSIYHSITLGGMLIVCISLIYILLKDNDQEIQQQVVIENRTLQDNANVAEPQQVPQTTEIPEGNTNIPPDKMDESLAPGHKPAPKKEAESEKPIIIEKKQSLVDKKQIDEEGTADFVDAHPVEGFPSLYEYLEREMRYPEEALEEGLEGTVLAEFTITKSGAVENVKIVKSLSPEIDQEAIRLLHDMPAWVPASLGDEKIKSKLTLPLTFKISSQKSK